MIFKNILRILKSYRLSLFKIIFFELFFLIRGYKGNKFNFSKNDLMTDNIPCPYYFLVKIKKILIERDFNKFLDLGCGSGRVINFFNNTFTNKNFIGIEYFSDQFNYCKSKFNREKNIQVIQEDFTKYDFLHLQADCYFFNHPIKNDSIFIEIVKKVINFSLNKKNILLIFVNCNDKLFLSLKNIKLIDKYYLNEKKGYFIYCVSKND